MGSKVTLWEGRRDVQSDVSRIVEISLPRSKSNLLSKSFLNI